MRRLGWAACVIIAACCWYAGGQSISRGSAAIFKDVAPLSKFPYRTNNGYNGVRKFFPQPMCGGVAILDFDGDGKMDIFLTNGAPFPSLHKTAEHLNALLRNQGGGRFEDVTLKSGLAGADLGFSLGAAAGDYDNDGLPDLFVANIGRNALYHNNGDGTFSDVTAGSGLITKPADVISTGAAWLDFDHDGLLDLVVAEYVHWTPAIDKECALNGVKGYCSPTMYEGSVQRLYHNLGKGHFEDVTDKAGLGKVKGKGMGIGIADVNDDGRMDVFIANDTLRNLLFINRPDGTFAESALAYGAGYNDDGAAVSGMGVDIKDIDNDGLPDIVYNDLMTQLFGLLHNVAGKRFDYASTRYGLDRLSRNFSGWSMAFIDFDNDGWKDIYSANGDIEDIGPNSKQHDTMWRNIEGRRFEDVSGGMGSGFLQLGYQRGAAIADLNNDGAMDLVVTSLGSRPRILLNSGNDNHWLMLELRGVRSNRDAIGAKVKLILPSGRTLYNHVSPAAGFLSSSDKRVHFGLGHEATVRSLAIRWPSGTEQRLLNVRADQIIKIAETID